MPPPSPEQPSYPAYPAAGAPSAQFGRYQAALRQKWWILAATLTLATGAAIAYLYFRPSQFASKATMWVSGKFRVGEIGQYTEDVQTFYGTQIEILTSGKMMERAVARLKTTNPGFDPPRSPKGLIITPKLRIAQTPKSAVFGLESVSTNAAFAQSYLDALMDEFLAFKKEVRAASSGNALSSVSDQVYKQERELKLEQEKLAEFQRTNNVALLQEQASGGGNQLGQLNTQLAAHRLELQLLEATALEESIGKGPRTNLLAAVAEAQKPNPDGSTNAAKGADFLGSRQQVQILKITRQQLSRYLRPKHPKIVRLDDEIARGEEVLAFFGKQTQEQMEVARQALKVRIVSVQETVRGLERQVGEATLRLSEFDRIKNNIQRQQSLYDRLLGLLQSVDINSTMDQETVAILERASKGLPANESPFKILAAALFLGGCLGASLLFLAAKFDDRCDTLEELRLRFEEEIFGQIPEVHSPNSNGFLPLLKLEDGRHIFAESCRNLRSLLLCGAAQGERARTILITSAAPDEGKSTIAVNLARVLAFGGAQTLLVDCDLRRGQLHEHMDVANVYGLSDYLGADAPSKKIESGKRKAEIAAGGNAESGERQVEIDVEAEAESGKRKAESGRLVERGEGATQSEKAESGERKADIGHSVERGEEPLLPPTSDPRALPPDLRPPASGLCPLPTDLEHLFLIPRGSPAPVAGELFLKPAFDAFLQQARAEYDYVILDSIPVFAADDATTLASKMDGVLFVVRSGHTSAKLARHALDLLYQRQAKVMGLIFNRVNSNRSSYRYYKYTEYYSNTKAESGKQKVESEKPKAGM